MINKTKKAFSLIEVIFVLVILGIVASISSQIIVQVYESYITQRAVYNVNTKTELAINQIVNRLTYSVSGSAIAKDASDSTHYKLLNDLDFLDVNDSKLTILEWIGYDNDSFSAGDTPYWSGVADYTASTKDILETPASKLSKVDEIIKNLSNNKVGLKAFNNPAIIFAPRTVEGDEINAKCMGLVDNNTSCIHSVTWETDTSFDFNTTSSKLITERYLFTWSAYALVPIDEAPIGDGLYNLYLYYNYQPWNNERYKDDGTKKLLLTNVSVFKFTENGGVIQLKLCATENIGADYNISSCKEKAIIK